MHPSFIIFTDTNQRDDAESKDCNESMMRDGKEVVLEERRGKSKVVVHSLFTDTN